MWPLIITACKAAELAAVILAPFVVPFADKYSGRLPRGFRWLETPDDPLPGGQYEPQVRKVYDRFGFYVGSVYWLWRNRAYRFAQQFAYRPRVFLKPGGRLEVDGYYIGALNVGDDEGDREGVCRFYAGDAWEFYKVKRLFGDFGYRIRCGWKLAPFFRTPFLEWPYDLEKTAWGLPVLHVSLRRIKSEKAK